MHSDLWFLPGEGFPCWGEGLTPELHPPAATQHCTHKRREAGNTILILARSFTYTVKLVWKNSVGSVAVDFPVRQLLVNIIEEQLSPSGCCYLFPTKPLIFNNIPASIFYDYQPFSNTLCTLFIKVSNHTGTVYHQCTAAPPCKHARRLTNTGLSRRLLFMSHVKPKVSESLSWKHSKLSLCTWSNLSYVRTVV